jgi:chemotaxis protein CheD
MHRFYDSKFAKKVISIGPGEYLISNEDIIIQTVLGSCVAVCLYTDYDVFCGMNHFMLPGEVFEGGDIKDYDSARYGIYSMEILINSLMKEGINKYNLKAKVFGGGNVIDIKSIKATIGENNVSFILRYLEKEKIPVISQHLGGDKARKILFFVNNKKVLLKEINKLAAFTTAREEIIYERKIEEDLKKPKDNYISFLD